MGLIGFSVTSAEEMITIGLAMIEHWFVGLIGFSVTSEATITTGLAVNGLIFDFLFCFYGKVLRFFVCFFFDLRTFDSFEVCNLMWNSEGEMKLYL